jgi:hypothetical protein
MPLWNFRSMFLQYFDGSLEGDTLPMMGRCNSMMPVLL